MARLRSGAVLAVFAVLFQATATADQAAGIPKTEPAQTEELMKRVEHMKLAFGIQPPPLLGLERQARQVQVPRPKTPPPRDPSPDDAKSLPLVSQSSVDSLEQVSEADLGAATGTAGPRDAGFDRSHIDGECLGMLDFRTLQPRKLQPGRLVAVFGGRVCVWLCCLPCCCHAVRHSRALAGVP
jgi:hypothetical protein